ncbi:hypothetical protein C8250_042835 [Streptomyces sp. So13.3]|uniref:hypothetical protein n=1 Tax=Streptomyces sp. So13.3 TaxID=2136173 RepID=UPI00110615BD|nr:hypothetical protein [Streptomyces sp. So13.3]QNA77609.1 hypothetical protein C8250_042835 [Streptomyces sp. So13.3]
MSISIPTATQPAHTVNFDHTTGFDPTFDQKGFAAAPSGLTNTDVAAQSTAEGATLYTVIKGSNAPTQMTYNLSLPPGAVLLPSTADSDGTASSDPDNPENPAAGRVSYTIELNGAVVGTIDAPWAKDANGVSVPTSYTLQGNHLIQTVNHAGAAYPVVADPHVSFGWWIYVRFSKEEAKGVAHKIAVGTPAVAAVCGIMPHTHNLYLFCTSLASAVLIHIAHVFTVAAEPPPQCVEMKFAYSAVFRIKRYDC